MQTLVTIFVTLCITTNGHKKCEVHKLECKYNANTQVTTSCIDKGVVK